MAGYSTVLHQHRIAWKRHKDIVCTVFLGRKGLDFGEAGSNKRWDTADCKEKSKMVTDELRGGETNGKSSWHDVSRCLTEVGEIR